MVNRSMILLATGLLLGGCSGPPGTRAERRDADAAGEAYRTGRSDRELPTLAEPLRVDDLLRHAFLANASLEADYHRWRQALERIPQASSWEQPQLGFKYLTSSGVMRTWDRTTLELSQTIPTAGKRGLKADAALSEALTARRRFEQSKFEIQRKVLSAAAEYRVLGQALAAGEENLRLLDALVSTMAQRQRSGKVAQRDVLAVEGMRDTAQNDLKALQAQRPAKAAMLNALLGREAVLPLPWPQEEPPEPVPADDEAILRLAAERNPELAALAAEVRGRKDALGYARRAWVPDLKLGYEVMGDLEASVTGMLMLPLRTGVIRAAIREAHSGLDEAEAMRLASQDDLRSRVVIALAMARDADRQARYFGGVALPRAEGILSSLRSAYRAGSVDYAEVNEGERTLPMIRLARDQSLAAREKALADLEAILAVDRGAWAAAQPKPEEKTHE